MQQNAKHWVKAQVEERRSPGVHAVSRAAKACAREAAHSTTRPLSSSGAHPDANIVQVPIIHMRNEPHRFGHNLILHPVRICSHSREVHASVWLLFSSCRAQRTRMCSQQKLRAAMVKCGGPVNSMICAGTHREHRMRATGAKGKRGASAWRPTSGQKSASHRTRGRSPRAWSRCAHPRRQRARPS